MKTILDVLMSFDEKLHLLYDKPEIDSIKYLAVSDVTGLSKAQLRAFTGNEITTPQAEKLTDIANQLQTGIPLQYILGHTEFYGLNFQVNPSVLIPRPETEELVEWIIQAAQERHQQEAILDIGTGSGCIPVKLKKHLPDAEVSAIDISPAALQTAKQNATLNGVDVAFIEADILNPVEISFPQYSILVSNPPYVTEREKAHMHVNVLNNEPHLALFVSDHDPLVFYRAIADFALQHLTSNGLLFFEINENLGQQMIDLLQDKNLKNIELRQDMRGKDRMIKAQKA
ncbi:peptide chain release factor N(5)-glutamine methyltransferase [Mucilaginibacter paludis]|nr:peptide chain release factor N(5)-glutamine methyltransferase [Mucilaginibacter paludis]